MTESECEMKATARSPFEGTAPPITAHHRFCLDLWHTLAVPPLVGSGLPEMRNAVTQYEVLLISFFKVAQAQMKSTHEMR